MQWQTPVVIGTLRPSAFLATRGFSTTTHHSIKPVQSLPSWEIDAFKELAFRPAIPAFLPFSRNTLPPACQKWFSYSDSPDVPSNRVEESLELSLIFWQQYQDITVPIELTQTSLSGEKTFHRANAPMKVFIEQSAPLRSAIAAAKGRPAGLTRPLLYIAQCPLIDLPSSLQKDLPTPKLVLKAGKGDVYDSSLWMGRPPTFTPLHKDPNPNLFMQLAGKKIVRLFNPEIGGTIFDSVQMKLGGIGHATFRGEEMFQGREREELEDAVWDNSAGDMSGLQKEGFEVRLSMGDALFIPKGWWHSIRGTGVGMNASANWWFR